MRGLVAGNWFRQINFEALQQSQTDKTLADQFSFAGYRNWVEPSVLRAQPERYHLYVSYACPFAHRVILMRALLGLEKVISMSVADPYLGGEQGWWFQTPTQASDYDGVTPDELYSASYLHTIYTKADAAYTGRVTVPVLWDKQAETIVSNDSAAIMRMLNRAFGSRPSGTDLYPDSSRSAIDEMNRFIVENINLGVYRVGTADSQTAYESAVGELFEALHHVDSWLKKQPFLVGEQITESDCLLFTTGIRFDVAYYPVLYTSLKRWSDFPNLSAHLQRMLAVEAISATVKLDHYRKHYFDDDAFINRRRLPNGHFIIPL